MERLCPKCGMRTAETRCTVDGTATLQLAHNPEARLQQGAEVNGRYRVGTLIGQGGFGAVYRAKNLATDQDIALKLLAVPLDQGDTDMILRFFAEAQVTASLKHPNTIRVFDFGQAEGGALYIAMELLTGRPLNEELRERLQQGRTFAVEEVIAIGSQVLRSLAEAHAANLVHRDLKPHNIFLHTVEDDDPVVKVLDFGIAKRLGSNLTGTGKAFGTPAYMSPEQAQNRPIDRRSDLYALGCVLYQLVAGRPPFDGENPLAVLLSHVTEKPMDLRQIVATPVSEALVRVIERSMAKDPDARFASAVEMRQALEACRSASALSTPAFTHPVDAAQPHPAWNQLTTGYGVAAVDPHGRTEAYAPVPAVAAPALDVPPPPLQGPPSGPAPVVRLDAATTSQQMQATRPTQDEGVLPEAAASTPPPRRGWAVVVAVVALGGLGAWWWQGRERTSDPAAAHAAAVAAVDPKPAEQADTGASTAPAVAAPTLPADDVAVELVSVPAGAAVEIGGKGQGSTPLVLHIAASQVLQVQLRLAGFKPQTVDVTRQSAPRREVVLQAESKAEAAPVQKNKDAEPPVRPVEPAAEKTVRPRSGVRPDPSRPKEKNALDERL